MMGSAGSWFASGLSQFTGISLVAFCLLCTRIQSVKRATQPIPRQSRHHVIPSAHLALLEVTVLVFLDAALDEDLLDSRAASASSFSICPTAEARETGCDRDGVVVPDAPSLCGPEPPSSDSRLASFRCWKYSSTQESAKKHKMFENFILKRLRLVSTNSRKPDESGFAWNQE